LSHPFFSVCFSVLQILLSQRYTLSVFLVCNNGERELMLLFLIDKMREGRMNQEIYAFKEYQTSVFVPQSRAVLVAGPLVPFSQVLLCYTSGILRIVQLFLIG